MNTPTAKWIEQAVQTIKSGFADKLFYKGVTVYRVGKIIRIDVKEDN